MNLKCIFGHKFEKIIKEKGSVTYTNNIKYDVVFVIEKCKHCLKEKAYYIDFQGKNSLEVDYTRMILNKRA